MVWEHDKPNAGFSTGRPWLPVKPPQAGLSVDLQEAANDSILHFYKSIIAFRKAQPALMAGKTLFIDLPEPLIAFHRQADKQNMTCAFNLSKDSQTIQLTGTARLTGPRHASLEGPTLTLPGNGFAYLTHEGALVLSV